MKIKKNIWKYVNSRTTNNKLKHKFFFNCSFIISLSSSKEKYLEIKKPYKSNVQKKIEEL